MKSITYALASVVLLIGSHQAMADFTADDLKFKFQEPEVALQFENRSSTPLQQFTVVVETKCSTLPKVQDSEYHVVEFVCPTFKTERFKVEASGKFQLKANTREFSISPSPKTPIHGSLYRTFDREDSLSMTKEIFLETPSGEKARVASAYYRAKIRYGRENQESTKFSSHFYKYGRAEQFKYIVFETPEVKIPIVRRGDKSIEESLIDFLSIRASASFPSSSASSSSSLEPAEEFSSSSRPRLQWKYDQTSRMATMTLVKRLYLTDGSEPINTTDPIITISFWGDVFRHNAWFYIHALRLPDSSVMKKCPGRMSNDSTQFCFQISEAYRDGEWQLDPIYVGS